MVDLAQRRVAEIAGLKEALSILANDHALEGTPLRPPLGWSSWLVASLSAVAEAAKDCHVLIWERGRRVRDERLVLDLCGCGHRASGGVVRRTNCEPHIRRLEVNRRRPWKLHDGVQGEEIESERSTGPGSDENHVADEDIADTREHESKNDSQFESSP